MAIQLIGSNICPFVQRSLIMLSLTNHPFEKKFIALPEKPDWFVQISPTGKVPVLEFNESYIFESLVINEFLNEHFNLALQVSNPLQKALNRSWSEYSSIFLSKLYLLVRIDNKTDFDSCLDEINKGLNWVETSVIKLPYFNGNDFSLTDIAFAPVFYRFEHLNETYGLNFFINTPKIKEWSANILKHEAIKNSTPDNYKELLNTYVHKLKGFITTL